MVWIVYEPVVRYGGLWVLMMGSQGGSGAPGQGPASLATTDSLDIAMCCDAVPCQGPEQRKRRLYHQNVIIWIRSRQGRNLKYTPPMM